MIEMRTKVDCRGQVGMKANGCPSSFAKAEAREDAEYMGWFVWRAVHTTTMLASCGPWTLKQSGQMLYKIQNAEGTSR